MAEETIPAGKTEAKPKVLLADDSKLVRVTARRTLSEQFELILAEDGEQAWEKLCEHGDIQVVFTDLGMPELDGYGLIQRIRQSSDPAIRQQPVVVITGAAEDESVRRKVFEVGATDFITKPFKSTELVARAESHASYRQDAARLRESVDVDTATGALNAKGLNEKLERDVSFSKRHNANLAVIVFELDNFQQIYDQVGQKTSERVIGEVAKTLMGAVRKEDSVGRLGLERFVAILPMAKTESVTVLAKRLCARIEQFKLNVRGEPVALSMSAGIGAAAKGSPDTSAHGLLATAESALGNARQLGTGQVQLLKGEGAAEAEPEQPEVSIDELLASVERGQTVLDESQLEAAVQRLQPLVALLSSAQQQRLVGEP